MTASESEPSQVMTAITYALLAITADDDGDHTKALVHIAKAHQLSRPTARRIRQVLEIATLVVNDNPKRATGLATMHVAEFPDDANLLARFTKPTSTNDQPS